MRTLAILGAAAALAVSGCVPPPPEPPAEAPRFAAYDRACELALEGKVEPAFAALEEAVGEGFGRIGFDHLVADPDLVPLHGDPRWGALQRRLSWNEEVVLVPREAMQEGRAPMAVIIRGPWHREPPGPIRFTFSPPAGCAVALPAPPYLFGPDQCEWTTRLDRGARAAAKVEFAVELAAKEFPVDRERLVLVGSGEEGVRVAWEVLLRRPDLFDAAVLDGPELPAWALLDRGRERVRTRILDSKPSLDDALAEALR